MHDRHDLTDDQWARLEPLRPDRTPARGGRWMDHRMVIDGVLWRTRTGSPWRDLPAEYGNWKTVYGRHRRWSADGTWTAVLAELRRGADSDIDGEWALGVDATIVRAHHHAAGARREPPKDVPADVLAPTVLEDAASARSRTGGGIELQGSARVGEQTGRTGMFRA